MIYKNENGKLISLGQSNFELERDLQRFVENKTSNNKSNIQVSEKTHKSDSNVSYDEYDEYFITAPIDGTVITKDAKVGDKIQKSSSSAKTLATIYDLSELTFDMDIDE